MALVRLLVDHAEELEADFAQYYHIDLNDLLDRGQYRKANVLTRQLPACSRLLVAINPQNAWSTTDHLVALVADNLAFMRYEQSMSRHRKKPKPIERPKRPKQKRGQTTVHGKSKEQVWSVLSAPRHK